MSRSPRVLVAVDGSHFADFALKWYCDKLHVDGNKVILCHVREHVIQQKFGFRVGLAISEDEWNEALQEMEKKEENIMSEYGKILQERKIPFETVAAFGDPGHHICQVAKDNGVFLTVTGCRGQGKVRRTVLGSVSDYILHHAHCPVVICHKP